MSDFDISGVLRLDTTDLDSALGRVGGTMKKLVGLAAGVFAVDKVLDWGKAGLKAAGDYEQSEIAFTSLLGSAERAHKFMAEMRDFVVKTPFEFPGLADASRKLLGYGFAVESIIPIMTDIGNTASALGVSEQGINGFVRALGQMRGKGKVSADEIRQISENIPGFNAAATIAAAKGITVAETYKLMEKGAIPAAEGIDAILNGMRNYPGAAGAMERQNMTLLGSVNMLKETIRFAAVDVFKPYMPAITGLLRGFAASVNATVVPALKKGSTSLFNFSRVVKTTLAPSFQAASKAFDELLGGIDNPDALKLNLLRELGEAFDRVGVAFRAFVDGFSGTTTVGSQATLMAKAFTLAGVAAWGLLEAGVELGAFLAEHADAVHNVIAVLAGLYAGYRALLIVNAVAGVINGFGGSIERMGEKAAKSTKEIRQLARTMGRIGSKTISLTVSGAQKAIEAAQSVGQSLSRLEDRIVKVAVDYQEDQASKAGSTAGKSFLGSFGGYIGGALSSVIVSGISLGGIGSALAGLAGTIAAAVFSVPVLIGAAVVGAAVLAYTFRDEIGRFFTETLPQFLQQTLTKALDFGAAVRDKGAELIDNLKAGAERAFDAFIAFVARIPENVAYGLGYAVGTLYIKGKQLIEGLWNGAKEVFANLEVWFTESVPKFIAAVGDTLAALVQKGKDLFQGFWNGVSAAWDAGISFLAELPGKAVKLIGDVASTLLGVGKDLLQGLWKGIQIVWEDPLRFFVELPLTIVKFFLGAGAWLFLQGKDIIIGLWGGIATAWDAGFKFFTELPGKVLAALGDAKTWLVQAGKDVIQGFLNGLNEMAEKVKDAANFMGKHFLRGFNDAVENKSPSKLMKKAGVNVMEGLIIGIESQRSALASEVGRVASALNPLTDAGSVGLSSHIAVATSGSASGGGVTIGDIHIHGASDPDDPAWTRELVGALRAGVGRG